MTEFIKFSPDGITPTDLEIEKLSDQIRCKLPPRFITFLQNETLEIPRSNSYKISATDDGQITNFISFTDLAKSYFDISRAYEFTGVLPFADCEFGNYVCINIDEASPSYGHILDLEHETGELIYLAQSIYDFLNKVEFLDTKKFDFSGIKAEVTLTDDARKIRESFKESN